MWATKSWSHSSKAIRTALTSSGAYGIALPLRQRKQIGGIRIERPRHAAHAADKRGAEGAVGHAPRGARKSLDAGLLITYRDQIAAARDHRGAKRECNTVACGASLRCLVELRQVEQRETVDAYLLRNQGPCRQLCAELK